MTIQEMIDYYVNLLIIQYRDKPNARATVEAYTKQAIADLILVDVRDGFDIDTAVGHQLDVIGKYVNVRRNINGLDITRDFFAMPPYSDPSPETYEGFSIYGSTPTGYFRLYSDVNTAYAMKDSEMRDVIKFKIRVQKSEHGLADIDDIIDEFFGADCLVTDNLDMSVNYDFTPGLEYNLPKIVAFLGILPKPAGVEVIITGI